MSLTLNGGLLHVFQIGGKMTVKDISCFGYAEEKLTLPDLPQEYLDVTLIDNDNSEIEEIVESYPLAASDVITASIIGTSKLTTGDDVKEIYSLELNCDISTYQPGDTIGIITRNPSENVHKLFNHLGITNFAKQKCKVVLKSTTVKTSLIPSFVDKIVSLEYIFTNYLDIHCVPKKSIIRVLVEFTKDSDEKKYLKELCSKEKSDLYKEQVLNVNLTFLDLLLKLPSCCPPVARLIENLPKLNPRPYSIASSPLASPNKLKIVFSVVKIENSVRAEGLCTGMLKNLICEEKKDSLNVKMFLRKCNGFNLPKSDVPLILIGPGTGIAPFMGFLEHRKLEGKKGKIWLFYGCRHKTKDYLFKKELQEYLSDGVLTKLLVAFSRDDDEEAKYVQDNLKKYGADICHLLFEEGAMVYVCGDAKNMRKDVQNAFVEILETCKGMSNGEATNFIKKLSKEKRYLQDIWL